MEHLNSVILRGIIGSSIRQNVGNMQMIRFSLATNYAYLSQGETVIETTWHQISAFKNNRMPDFASLVKGSIVEVKGRIRYQRYVNADGTDKQVCEIVAAELSILDDKLKPTTRE